MNPNAGGAFPITVVTSGPVTAAAYPAYLFDVTTLGSRPLLGGNAQPVVYLAASDLDVNGGTYHLQAETYAMPVMVVTDGRGLESTPAMALYLVGGVSPITDNALLLPDLSYFLLPDGVSHLLLP